MAGATTGYQYSSRGELMRVDLPTGTVIEYVHDPLGRRIAKKVGGTVVERYLWQGRMRLLAVYDGSGSLKQRFEYADARLPVALTVGSARYFLVTDQVGSLRAVTDSSGNTVKTVEYDSFGNVIADSNTAFKLPFSFVGGLCDADTGLTRFGYRDYDADVGRWTAKDPIGFEGGDTDLYGYVVGDPVNLVDPKGASYLPPPLINFLAKQFAKQVGKRFGKEMSRKFDPDFNPPDDEWVKERMKETNRDTDNDGIPDDRDKDDDDDGVPDDEDSSPNDPCAPNPCRKQ